ncbi:hypothetical protein DMN91_002857 [Ooceraea biroi]|uniref:Uncharacterized protein n=1 Tax=Ooceraea biroi TaxID=2015173 RepID=A0A3L8DWF2_OOCBI|nr:hypothetical protein DMN91_002857 [Ooceraea biroi]
MRDLLVNIYSVDYIKQTLLRWLDTMFRLYNKQDGDLCQQVLPKIKCPTLIFHGSENTFLVPNQPLHLKQNIVDSTIYIFENDTPDDFTGYLEVVNKVITEFLLEK